MPLAPWCFLPGPWGHQLSSLADVPEAIAEQINEGSYRGAQSPHDVISFIKKHISDEGLSQPPMLVLTTNRAHRLTLVPDEKPLVEIQKTAPTFLLTCLLDLIVENQSLTTGCQKAMLV